MIVRTLSGPAVLKAIAFGPGRLLGVRAAIPTDINLFDGHGRFIGGLANARGRTCDILFDGLYIDTPCTASIVIEME